MRPLSLESAFPVEQAPSNLVPVLRLVLTAFLRDMAGEAIKLPVVLLAMAQVAF